MFVGRARKELKTIMWEQSSAILRKEAPSLRQYRSIAHPETQNQQHTGWEREKMLGKFSLFVSTGMEIGLHLRMDPFRNKPDFPNGGRIPVW